MKPSRLCKQTDCVHCPSYKECIEIEYDNLIEQGKYSAVELRGCFTIVNNNET